MLSHASCCVSTLTRVDVSLSHDALASSKQSVVYLGHLGYEREREREREMPREAHM
jgi:hypothetical protein